MEDVSVNDALRAENKKLRKELEQWKVDFTVQRQLKSLNDQVVKANDTIFQLERIIQDLRIKLFNNIRDLESKKKPEKVEKEPEPVKEKLIYQGEIVLREDAKPKRTAKIKPKKEPKPKKEKKVYISCRTKQFTDDQVRAIRKDNRQHAEIAKEYGVGKSAISRVKRRVTFAKVED